jgi:predicted TIM-barrel fold metal-dependent hydrolase
MLAWYSMDKISRRRAIVSGAMAGAAAFLGRSPHVLAKASQPLTKVDFPVPDGACDCHVHVFGDPQRYPFFPGRVYTPEPASVEELRSTLAALRMNRVVVVQPSVYGTNNTRTLDAVRELGARARGIAVIDANTTDAALDDMARAGIRGIRLNLTQAGVNDPLAALPGFRAAVERATRRGWHVQLNTSLKMIEALRQDLLASPVPIVIDHFGGALAAQGVQQPGFSALVALVKSGKAYVKISAAADLVSTQAPAYADVSPLARALVEANPARILWGTNWPHPDSQVLPGRKNTDIAPLLQTDDGRILNLLPTWVPDAATRQLILVANPARLYGF